jgi:hypothetical protein
MSGARLLNYNDKDQFVNLINRKFHAKELKAENSNEKFLSMLEKSGNSNIRVYGYFNSQEELLSASCQYMWPNLPFYTMVWGLIHPKYSNTVFSKSVGESGARESFDVALKYAESVDRFQFFYGMTLRNFKTRRDLWLNAESHLSTHYDRNIETIIPAGTIPEYEAWKGIIGFQPRQQAIIIKSCRLKNEFVYEKVSSRGLIDIPYDSVYKK